MLSTGLRNKFSDDERLDLVFRALGDRTRRRILSRLTEGPAMVSELAKPFEMSLPAVGKHLRVLERAGLVSREIDGRIHRCSLSALPLHDANQWLDRYRVFWDETLDALTHHFQNEKNDD
ncbi:MAG: metalloregulator ArsR/SmtB family transcription factor [Betaproteobacteria bacterium]